MERSADLDRPLFTDLRQWSDDFGAADPVIDPLSMNDVPGPDDEYILGAATPAIAQLLPETKRRRTLQRYALTAAGYHSRVAWINLNALRFTLAFTALIVIGVWLQVAPQSLESLLLALVVVAPLVMWAIPPLVVAVKAQERRSEIERGLPDVLDMLNMCVSQGLTVPQSLARIGGEIAVSHPALAQELRIVHHQTQAGSLIHALKAFGQRITSPDVNSFTTLLIQSEATGTSVSQALKDYSDSIRSSLRERADARANAASFKLLFPISLCLMPSVFLFLLGPAIIEMSDFFGNRVTILDNDRRQAMDVLNRQPQTRTGQAPLNRF